MKWKENIVKFWVKLENQKITKYLTCFVNYKKNTIALNSNGDKRIQTLDCKNTFCQHFYFGTSKVVKNNNENIFKQKLLKIIWL